MNGSRDSVAAEVIGPLSPPRLPAASQANQFMSHEVVARLSARQCLRIIEG